MITVHDAWATDYTGLGLCTLTPLECTVEEQAGGLYQLKLTHPMDAGGKWWFLKEWNILRAPAPVRETPLIRMAGESTPGETIFREIWRVRVRSRLRLRTEPSTETGVIIGRYGDGQEVIKLGQTGEWFQVIVTDGGATGWMHGDYLEYVRSETEVIPGTDLPGKTVQPRQTREQLFRIVSVDKDDAAGRVHVTAQHLFYDLAGIPLTDDFAPEGLPADRCTAELEKRMLRNPGFHLYCSAQEPVTGTYTGMSVAAALLEKDGIVQQAHARLVRDNRDVFILQDEARDRGVEIRHGKNLLGAILTTDVSGVTTAVLPVGKDANGNPLRLPEPVESPNAALLPVFRAREIEYDVRSGSEEFPTDDAARAELARLAALEFSENAIDAPTVGLDVEFALLENTRQYAQYAPLQSVHLYDTVRVISPRSGIDARVRVTGYVYNCLTRQYDSVTLGELFSLKSSVSGYDLTPGSVTGSRLVVGTVDGDRLRDATIRYAKIHQATIGQLNAESITALTGRFNEIAAGSITADELYAAFARVLTLAVGDITADNISTDQLAAVMGEFVKLYAEFAGVDFAQIKDLTTDELIFRIGAAGELYIDRLAATSATLVSAVIGDLVLKGADGRYYTVTVKNDGTIGTDEVYPSDAEIAAGERDGMPIVGTTANVRDLNAQSIKAASAIISEIFTDALTAGSITAGQAMIASATIPELYTTSIKAIGDSIDVSANTTIRLLIATNDLIRAWYTFSEEGMRVGKTGSTYATLTDDTGFHILQKDEIIGSFAKRQLAAESVRVGPVNRTGPAVVMRRSPKGGIAFVTEET